MTLFSAVIDKIYLLIFFAGYWNTISCFFGLCNIFCVTRYIFEILGQMISLKKHTCLNLVIFFGLIICF